MLEVQQNSVAGIDLPAQYQAVEDMVNEETRSGRRAEAAVLTSVVGLGSVSGGIKAKNLEFCQREILQTYGYQHLPLLLALQKVGLLTRASPTPSVGGSTGGLLSSVVGGGSSANAGGDADTRGNAEEGGRGSFASVRKILRLINDDVDERAPADISYVYSGYAPLSVRLVQAVAQKEALLDLSRSDPRPVRSVKPRAHAIVGWRGFEDAVNQLPGATFDEVQTEPVTAGRTAERC